MRIQLLSNTLSIYINGVEKKVNISPKREAANYIWIYFYAVFSSHLIRAVGTTFASLQAFWAWLSPDSKAVVLCGRFRKESIGK